MSGMINNFYYGKAGQADFTPDQMPTNRFQLFFEMLRVHFSGLFGINLFYILFCIPAILWTLMQMPFLYQEDLPDTLQAFNFLPTYLLILVPCLGICGIGAPGLMYVVRNWARDQHAFTFSDFKDNVKANWKCGLCVGLINGLSLVIGYVGALFYSQMAATNVMFVIPQTLVVIMVVFWWMMNMVIFPMMVTYDMTFLQLIRNSAIITLARLPWALLTLVGSLIPMAVLVLITMHPYALLAVVVIYLAVGFALTGMVYASYANAAFDKFLNPNIQGAPVGMGLRDPNLEDDLDDVEDPNPLT